MAVKINGSEYKIMINGSEYYAKCNGVDYGSVNEYTKQYKISNTQSYYGNGSQDNSSSAEHRIGSYSSSSSTNYKCLVWFNSALRTDISGSTIKSARLYLYRNSSSHGNSGTSHVRVRKHNVSSAPSTWSTTNVSSVIVSVDSSLGRGSGKWYTLPVSFVEQLRDNTMKGIAFYITSNDIGYYIRYIASSTIIEITYEK